MDLTRLTRIAPMVMGGAWLLAGPSWAQTAPMAAPAPAASPAPPAGLVINGIRLSAQAEGGITFAPSNPESGVNVGHLFTDRANQAVMNQLLLTAQKEIPKDASDFVLGFKLQAMYGTDARYIHYLGLLERVTDSRYQFDIVEGNIQAHVPFPTAGGMEVKAGLYPTPLGLETIDPSTNPFYSHSYIFNFGLPFKHTGVLTTTHLTPEYDLYLGIDSGTNTTIGRGDNNGAAAFLGGFGLNLMGGKLTVLALTHIGPELSSFAVAPNNPNGYYRYYNDILVTYKPDDVWTFTTEANLVRDDYGFAKSPVNGMGVSQYVGYALSEEVTLNGRAEVFRDDNNFFVAGFGNSLDPARALRGTSLQGPIYGASKATTYGELTVGLTYKPTLPEPVAAFMVRPEVRWDHAFTDSKPYNAGKNGLGRDNNAITLAADVVISF